MEFRVGNLGPRLPSPSAGQAGYAPVVNETEDRYILSPLSIIPAITEDDYGKVLTATEGGLAWKNTSAILEFGTIEDAGTTQEFDAPSGATYFAIKDKASGVFSMFLLQPTTYTTSFSGAQFYIKVTLKSEQYHVQVSSPSADVKIFYSEYMFLAI